MATEITLPGDPDFLTVLFNSTSEAPLVELEDSWFKCSRTLWAGENFSTAGSSQKALPSIVHPLLNLLSIPFREVAEMPLKFQILFNGNNLRFFLNRIGPSVL